MFQTYIWQDTAFYYQIFFHHFIAAVFYFPWPLVRDNIAVLSAIRSINPWQISFASAFKFQLAVLFAQWLQCWQYQSLQKSAITSPLFCNNCTWKLVWVIIDNMCRSIFIVLFRSRLSYHKVPFPKLYDTDECIRSVLYM